MKKLAQFLVALAITTIVLYVLWRLAQGPGPRDPGLPADPGEARREADAFWRDVEAHIDGGA